MRKWRNAKTQLFPSSRVFRDVLRSLSPFFILSERRQQTTNAVEINIFCRRTSQLSNVPYHSCYIEKVSKVPIWSLSWAPSDAIKLRSSTMFSISICIIRTFPNILIIFKTKRKMFDISLFLSSFEQLLVSPEIRSAGFSSYHSIIFSLYSFYSSMWWLLPKKWKELCTFSLSTTRRS